MINMGINEGRNQTTKKEEIKMFIKEMAKFVKAVIVMVALTGIITLGAVMAGII